MDDVGWKGRAESWEQLFSLAQLRLGLSPAQVLNLTPRYFHALVQAQRNEALIAEYRNRVTDHQLAQLIAMVGNTGFRGWEEARQPAEFLPLYAPEPGAKRPRRPSEKELSANLERTMDRAMRYQAAQVERGMTQ